MAGAPCPEELCKAVVDELGMKDFVVAYGMTETSPVTFQGFPDDDMLLKTSTVGYPMDHQEVKVVDGQGKTVAVGEVMNAITSRTFLHLYTSLFDLPKGWRALHSRLLHHALLLGRLGEDAGGGQVDT